MHREQNSSSRLLAPLGGWPLEKAILIDEAAPGFLRFCCSAKPGWRQAFAAALAGGLLVEHPAEFLARAVASPKKTAPWRCLLGEVSELLPVMTPKELLLAGLGLCPDGFRGALAKLGLTFLPAPEGYLRLLDTFTSTEAVKRAQRRVVEQMGRLDADSLDVIAALDPLFLLPDVVVRVKTAAHANELNAQLAVIRAACSTASDQALRESISHLGRRSFREWTAGWLRRADRGGAASYPWSADPSVATVTSTNVREIAAAWQNCLASPAQIARLLSGVWATAVLEDMGLIATFRALGDGRWLLTGLHGRGNVPVSETMTAEATAKFRLMPGCVVPAPVPAPMRAAVRWVSHVFDCDFGLDDLDNV
jgi:hypothetical protein